MNIKHIINFTAILFVFLTINNADIFAQNKKQNPNQDFLLAKQYMAENKYQEAAALLEDLIDKSFNDNYYRMLISAYNELQDTKKKEKLIKKAIKKSDNNSRYSIDLGTFYIENNDQSKGLKQYDKVIGNLKANNSDIIQTANYFSSIRNYDYAVKTYQQGRKLFKDNNKYTYELTYFYQRLGRNEDIAQEYLLLLEQNPKALHQIEVNINNLFSQDNDSKLYDVFSDIVLQQVKDKPKNLAINQLYYWLLMQKEDFSAAYNQAKALDKRFNLQSHDNVMDFAQNVSDRNLAIQAYDYLLKQKINDDDLTFIIRSQRLSRLYDQFTALIHHNQKDIAALEKEYNEFFALYGYIPETTEAIQQKADLLAYHINKPQQAVDLLDTIINMRNVSNQTKARCKLTRADIYLINGDIWEASLTYSQVDKDMKNETIGTEAKFRNAMLSYYTGDFAWAESQFNALRSSTTKLIANDAMEYSLLISANMDEDSSYKGLSWFAKSDFALYQNKVEEAKTYLDSIDRWYVSQPLFDEVLFKRAEIAIKEEKFDEAKNYLEDIILKYPYDLVADDAIMLLADLYENIFNDKAKAKECYERIILDYPSSLYIQQARKKYNTK